VQYNQPENVKTFTCFFKYFLKMCSAFLKVKWVPSLRDKLDNLGISEREEKRDKTPVSPISLITRSSDMLVRFIILVTGARRL